MTLLHQFLRASAQSGSVMLLGDLICQGISDGPTDWQRATRMGLVGATLHGPYFLLAFGAVDRYFGPATSFSTVLRKTALVQVTVFPVYLVLLFAYLGALDSRDPVTNAKEKMPTAYLGGSIFWPIANMVGFRYISSNSRVLYLASTGLVWNTFISYVND
jgi:protein Mpv17